MEKLHPRILFATLICLISIPFTANAFSDLPEISRYFPAIQYLHKAGIISGYTDGTFKPDNPVNRAEFLKLVLESSEIKTDIITPTGFPDVDNNAWYAKYVRKAYAEKWIEGYPDGTFKPEQHINKVEALKIIGEVQKWELPDKTADIPFEDIKSSDWFAPYVVFAKEKNFLEETTRNYIPETIFSRARISELLFRSFITRKSGSDIYSFNLINRFPASAFAIGLIEEPAPEPVVPAFTPTDFRSYPVDFYENIRLEENFPNIFYLNEIYIMKGQILKGTYDTAFVFLSQNGTQSYSFPAKVTDGKFEIPVVFTVPGNYKMGLIPGFEGESKVMEISVLANLPEPQSSTQKPEKPTGLKIFYKTGKTFIGFNNPGDTINKITFTQDGKEKEFITRQNIQSFGPDWIYFKGFSEGKTYLSASSADTESTYPLMIKNNWSEKSVTSFNAVNHQYRQIDTALISIASLPEILDTISSIRFGGTTKTDILTKAAIIKPDGFVDMVDISSSAPFAKYYGTDYLPSGNTFNFSYTPETAGTYAIEINGTDGSAVLNYPVYVTNGIPLIPNFFDLYERTDKDALFNLQDEITLQINLINKERIRFGLSPVIGDKDLNRLALLHSEDMVLRDFFGHINPDGETPNDRRLQLGIPTPVGENLAISPTSEYTIYGLMQSGVHRKNILDPKWTKVGIGVTIDHDGSLYTTQEFSTEKLTESDLPEIKNSIFDTVNTARTEAGIEEFTLDGSLDTPAEIWTDKMTGENFFDFVSPTEETLANVVRIYVPTKMVQALILEGNDSDGITAELMKSAEIMDMGWRKIGIGVNVDATGTLKTTVLFTTL